MKKQITHSQTDNYKDKEATTMTEEQKQTQALLTKHGIRPLTYIDREADKGSCRFYQENPPYDYNYSYEINRIAWFYSPSRHLPAAEMFNIMENDFKARYPTLIEITKNLSQKDKEAFYYRTTINEFMRSLANAIIDKAREQLEKEGIIITQKAINEKNENLKEYIKQSIDSFFETPAVQEADNKTAYHLWRLAKGYHLDLYPCSLITQEAEFIEDYFTNEGWQKFAKKYEKENGIKEGSLMAEELFYEDCLKIAKRIIKASDTPTAGIVLDNFIAEDSNKKDNNTITAQRQKTLTEYAIAEALQYKAEAESHAVPFL